MLLSSDSPESCVANAECSKVKAKIIVNIDKRRSFSVFNVIDYELFLIYKTELTSVDDFVYKYRSFLIF